MAIVIAVRLVCNAEGGYCVLHLDCGHEVKREMNHVHGMAGDAHMTEAKAAIRENRAPTHIMMPVDCERCAHGESVPAGTPRGRLVIRARGK